MTRSMIAMFHRFSREALEEWWHDRSPWLRVVIGVTGLAALSGMVWSLARPGYAEFKRWRMARNFQAAVVAVQAHDAMLARDLALSLVQAGDSRPEVLRMLEQSFASLGDDRQLATATALFNHPQASREDRLRIFRQIALECPFGQVQLQLGHLPADERESRAICLALAARALQDKNFPEVLKVLAKQPLEPPDPEVAACRIRAWIGQNTPQSLSLAQTRIVYFWQLDPDHAADWCGLLETVPVARLDPWILNPMRAWLTSGRPQRPGHGELMEARIRWMMQGEPSQAKAVVAEAVARWLQAAPLALSAFLSAVGDDERLVETFNDEVVAGNAELVLARIEALLRLNRNPEVAATLEAHQNALRRLDYLAFSAVSAHRAADNAAQIHWWGQALEEASHSTELSALLELHSLAFREGMLREAEESLLAAIKSGRGPLPSSFGISRLLDSLAKQGKEHDLLAVYSHYLYFEPRQPEVASRYCELAAMLELEPPAKLIDQMTALATTSPQQAQVIAVLATLHLLNDRPDLAAETWRKLPVSPDDLAPGFHAAYLTTEVLTGSRNKDESAIGDIPWAELLPCERRRLRALLDAGGHR